MPTVPIRTATNSQSNIAVVTLPDGSTAVAHIAIDETGAIVTPASSDDVQSIAAAINAQTAQLANQSLILTDAFGATPTDVFGNPI